MSKGPKKSLDRRRQPRIPGLTEEDLQLWDHMARTLRPFHGRNRRILPTNFDEPGFTPRITKDHAMGAARSPTLTESPAQLPHLPQRHDSNRPAPQLAKFETRKARKIRAGRIEIEARLDLHGMRQAEAHSALRSFLVRSRSRNLKWVLVITGKGTFARDGEHPDPLGGDWDAPPRGILRRNVPMWLAEPDMRAMVVSYTPAAVHHGGDGALYIQLRSAKK